MSISIQPFLSALGGVAGAFGGHHLAQDIRLQESAIRMGMAAVRAEKRRAGAEVFFSDFGTTTNTRRASTTLAEKPYVHLRDRKAPAWPTDLNERWWE